MSPSDDTTTLTGKPPTETPDSATSTLDDEQLANKTKVLSLQEHAPQSGPVSYSSEEIEAFEEVYRILVEQHNIDKERIGLRPLALTTIVSKLRPEEAAEKYSKFLQALDLVGVSSLASADTLEHLGDETVGKHLSMSYAPCGVDSHGRSIMWIQGSELIEEEMAQTAHAGILYWMAIHADSLSIHEGITFVIDTSTRKSLGKHPKDKVMQRLNQSYPLRPQSITICGANFAMRIVINSLIKIASVFAKAKVLNRIKFATVEQAFESVPEESGPTYLGGGGGGIEDVTSWVRMRLEALPVPELNNVQK